MSKKKPTIELARISIASILDKKFVRRNVLEIYRDLLKQLYITDVYGSQFNPFVNPWNEMHVKLETEIQTINTILE